MPVAEVGNPSPEGEHKSSVSVATEHHQQNSGEPSGDNECRRRPASAAASGTASADNAARISFSLAEDARSSGIGGRSRHRQNDAAAAAATGTRDAPDGEGSYKQDAKGGRETLHADTT